MLKQAIMTTLVCLGAPMLMRGQDARVESVKRMCKFDQVAKPDELTKGIVTEWKKLDIRNAPGLGPGWNKTSPNGGFYSFQEKGTAALWSLKRGQEFIYIRCFVAEMTNEAARARFIEETCHRLGRPDWMPGPNSEEATSVVSHRPGPAGSECVILSHNVCLSIDCSYTSVDAEPVGRWLIGIFQNSLQTDYREYAPKPSVRVAPTQAQVNEKININIDLPGKEIGQYDVEFETPGPEGIEWHNKPGFKNVISIDRPGKILFRYCVIDRTTLLSTSGHVDLDISGEARNKQVAPNTTMNKF